MARVLSSPFSSGFFNRLIIVFLVVLKKVRGISSTRFNYPSILSFEFHMFSKMYERLTVRLLALLERSSSIKSIALVMIKRLYSIC